MKKWIILSVLSSLLLFNSCFTPKKVVYLKDMVPDSVYQAQEPQSLLIQKGDRLRIVVQAKSPELAAPFNIETGSYQISDRGEVVEDNGRTARVKGYLVDEQGEIEFPILGRLHIDGMSIEQVRDMIQEHLVAEKLIDKPSVKIEMMNFKITVIGEVARQGLQEVPDGRINIFEAISSAGGLTLNGAADKVTVIRETNGVRKSIVNNLESKQIFDSPTYYLQQNDIVYVTPRSARLTPREEVAQRYTSIGISLLAIAATLIALFR